MTSPQRVRMNRVVDAFFIPKGGRPAPPGPSSLFMSPVQSTISCAIASCTARSNNVGTNTLPFRHSGVLPTVASRPSVLAWGTSVRDRMNLESQGRCTSSLDHSWLRRPWSRPHSAWRYRQPVFSSSSARMIRPPPPGAVLALPGSTDIPWASIPMTLRPPYSSSTGTTALTVTSGLRNKLGSILTGFNLHSGSPDTRTPRLPQGISSPNLYLKWLCLRHPARTPTALGTHAADRQPRSTPAGWLGGNKVKGTIQTPWMMTCSS